MDDRVKKLLTVSDCQNFARNASERGREDLAREARVRAIQIRAVEYGATTDVELECLQAIYAYEDGLTQKNQRKTKATRTWQMIARKGILLAVEELVSKDRESSGYTVLFELGLEEYAFEAIVIRHPDYFTEAAVAKSHERLEKWKTSPNG